MGINIKTTTIREKMIREIEESGKSRDEICYQCYLFDAQLDIYIQGNESALNGEETQRIFNYLNELK